jgi:hypothetical protein
LKCSVCAQDIPEDRYGDHLEAEHGVTDDPTAVLIQHLTGLHSNEGEGEGDEGLPDEEPSDADAFEEFLAAHPLRSPGEQEDANAGGAEEAPAAEAAPRVPEPEPEEPDEPESEEPEAEEPKSEDADSAEPAGEEPTDEDEAEFERMLSVYPEVDLRKGVPQPPAEPAEEGAEAAAGVAAAGAATAGAATAAADHDEKTFAVWDKARGAEPEDDPSGDAAPSDGDVLVVAPPAASEKARRRRQAAMVGLGAAIILAAIAVIYLLTRDTGTNNASTTGTVPTIATTVPPTFLPGPQGGVPTTVETTPPATTAPPATPATPATTAAPPPATTAPPNVDPKSQIAFPQMQGICTNGQLEVRGQTTNNNPQAYSYSFTITFANGSGGTLGTANGSVAHVPPHSTMSFTANGSCTDVNGAASRNVQITTISPG